MNKYYKNQFFLGIIFAVILVPVTLFFLNSPQAAKAYSLFTNQKKTEEVTFNHYIWDSNPHAVPKKISYAYLEFRVNYFKTHAHTKDSLDKIIRLAEKYLNSEEANQIKSRIFTEY